MATAKKCDICGKFYDHYNYEKNPNKPNGFCFVNHNKSYEGVFHGVAKDCCPNCMGTIKKVIDSMTMASADDGKEWIVKMYRRDPSLNSDNRMRLVSEHCMTCEAFHDNDPIHCACCEHIYKENV